ncbi:phosphate starvation-inducible PhoH-like protein [Arcanobacterium wilhelmae]|uniref:PhoH-like protein n=1 Tax=Arcanobacterium wilhelmae TaxID=1803177 RepID=A0ABT9NDD6_9ACTO|nr:PhoH family protein [Arcanobacterium wilhelmae]MDP9801729.1 phosphate starvation-inducible PhoH-like protein [Arcanobacterium wilhelmae]WFN91047.1 PhoH family protein [Arcanobacterium wilhelmae]
MMETLNLVVPASVPMINLLGHDDDVLRTLEGGLAPVTFHVRGHKITLNGPGEDVAIAGRLVRELISVVVGGEHLTTDAVERAISITKSGLAKPTALMKADIVTAHGKTIRPKTLGQKSYVEAIDANAVTFGIGPAGTGKTYLAVAKAVVALMNKDVKRIVLSRPVVEAGESLGYLPGSLNDKIDPYMRPLYDALYDMLDPEAIVKLLAAGTIEIAPLAYMRGRTLSDSFVILDEAQNTTREQMKMFLTRLGFGSKMVITGDLTQVDLPRKATSGLLLARRILRGVDNVAFADFGSADVVRNRIVADIIDAYTRYEEDES